MRSTYNRKHRILLLMIILFMFSGTFAFGESALELGIEAYRWNRPQEAKAHFEAALLKEKNNVEIYYYLGLVYELLDNNVKAIDALRKGLLISSAKKHIFYYHIANNYYTLKDYTLAEKNYSLSIAEDSLFSRAYLNRAQSKLSLALYKESVDDYKVYLRLDPETSQREEIERLIALLEGDIADQEKMIKALLDSIKNASEDTKTTSEGIEEFKDTGTEDIDIMD